MWFTGVALAPVVVRSKGAAGVGQQTHEAGSLDGLRHAALFYGRGPKSLTRIDLAVGGHHAAKFIDVLVVNPRIVLGVPEDDLRAA